MSEERNTVPSDSSEVQRSRPRHVPAGQPTGQPTEHAEPNRNPDSKKVRLVNRTDQTIRMSVVDDQGGVAEIVLEGRGSASDAFDPGRLTPYTRRLVEVGHLAQRAESER